MDFLEEEVVVVEVEAGNMNLTCPRCHTQVRETDYFCFNCGKNLKPKPVSTSIDTLLLYYLGTILLPPLGLWWGIRYLKNPDHPSKIHGLVLITITSIEVLLLVVWSVNFINNVNSQVNQQLNTLQGF